jgi:pimeloyl-ACP methyl ester carboxylesterase
MNTIPVSQTMLAFEVQGTGESVLLLHCGLVAHACHPLLQETVLTRDFMLINYHRRGYGASGSVQPPFSLELQAADCLALMDYLRIPQVHVVGHSYGANVAWSWCGARLNGSQPWRCSNRR